MGMSFRGIKSKFKRCLGEPDGDALCYVVLLSPLLQTWLHSWPKPHTSGTECADVSEVRRITMAVPGVLDWLADPFSGPARVHVSEAMPRSSERNKLKSAQVGLHGGMICCGTEGGAMDNTAVLLFDRY